MFKVFLRMHPNFNQINEILNLTAPKSNASNKSSYGSDKKFDQIRKL